MKLIAYISLFLTALYVIISAVVMILIGLAQLGALLLALGFIWLAVKIFSKKTLL